MESKSNHDMKCTYYVHVQCPISDPLSPPVQYYAVTVNDTSTVIVYDDGSCSYNATLTIAVSPQDAPYSVSVVATNDVGDSDAVLASKLNIFGGELLISST